MSVDYDVEYNNRARVPEHGEIFARWGRDAAAYRGGGHGFDRRVCGRNRDRIGQIVG